MKIFRLMMAVSIGVIAADALPAPAQDVDPLVESADTDRHGWWIHKHFDVDGDRYLSRQGFLPQPDGSVLRISQKSYDEGDTWELRFQQRLVRE